MLNGRSEPAMLVPAGTLMLHRDCCSCTTDTVFGQRDASSGARQPAFTTWWSRAGCRLSSRPWSRLGPFRSGVRGRSGRGSLERGHVGGRPRGVGRSRRTTARAQFRGNGGRTIRRVMAPPYVPNGLVGSAVGARIDRHCCSGRQTGDPFAGACRCSDTMLASSTLSRVSPFGDRIAASSVACRPVASRRPAPTWTARCIEQESSG